MKLLSIALVCGGLGLVGGIGFHPGEANAASGRIPAINRAVGIPRVVVNVTPNVVRILKEAEPAEERHARGDAEAVAIQSAVIRNTFIQGTMSIIFVAIVVWVIVSAVMRIVKTVSTKDTSNSEDPHQESNFFAPSTMVASKLDKKLVKEYSIVGDPNLIPGKGGHGGH